MRPFTAIRNLDKAWANPIRRLTCHGQIVETTKTKRATPSRSAEA